MEVCPDAGVIIQELSQRIASTGGAALIADYGHDGTKTDTLRVCVTQGMLYQHLLVRPEVH